LVLPQSECRFLDRTKAQKSPAADKTAEGLKVENRATKRAGGGKSGRPKGGSLVAFALPE